MKDSEVNDHEISHPELADLPVGKRLQGAGDARHHPAMCTGVHKQADNTADSAPCDRLHPDSPWYVYMVVCKDKTIYTGIARDLEKRLHDHNYGKTWARYTRSRRPVKLVYREAHPSRSAATGRECQLKKLTRTAKLRLIAAARLRTVRGQE
ncbi:MAG: GIY-YIG nuclease family protein [Desulfurivibrionaceae bacterium]